MTNAWVSGGCIDCLVWVCYLFVLLAEMVTCALPLTSPLGSDLHVKRSVKQKGHGVFYTTVLRRRLQCSIFLYLQNKYMYMHRFSSLPVE